MSEQTLRGGREHNKDSDLKINPCSETLSWRGSDGTKHKKERTRSRRENMLIILGAVKMPQQCSKMLRKLLHCGAAMEVRHNPGQILSCNRCLFNFLYVSCVFYHYHRAKITFPTIRFYVNLNPSHVAYLSLKFVWDTL